MPLVVLYHVAKTGGTNLRTRLMCYYNIEDVGFIYNTPTMNYDTFNTTNEMVSSGKNYNFVCGHFEFSFLKSDYLKNHIKIITFRDPYEVARSMYFQGIINGGNDEQFIFGPKNYLDSDRTTSFYEYHYCNMIELDIFDYVVEAPYVENFVSYLEKKLNLVKRIEVELNLNRNPNSDKEKYFDEYKDYCLNLISSDYNIYKILLERQNEWRTDE